MFFIVIFSFSPFFGDDVFSLYFDSHGNPRAGEWVLTVNDTQEPGLSLARSLGLGAVKIRTEGSIQYIASKEGQGYIPVLSFHKLGVNNEFELTKERFEDLLIYLQVNGFHVISDKQYFSEDYTHAVNGKKLIVMGSDDGSTGVFYYKTENDVKTGNFIMDHGQYIISHNSMVYFLNKHLPREEGRGNFTFYITFDAIPFRQTGGGGNPGPPYTSMFALLSKLNYLEKNYYIGNHTANHLYTEELQESEFIEEVKGFYDIMESYGIKVSDISTLAFPFGIGDITAERENTVKEFRYKGIELAGAFDYDGFFSYPISSGKVNPYDVSRIGVDNKSYGKIMTLLENTYIFRSRRIVLFDSVDYPFDLSLMDIDKNDSNYILIRN
ncbi:MAG: hypothetical protein JEY91_06390 [Spirochaetaceae bacterium]|nr:hypothetical protein [Spirochaetaceae bacterium]